MLKEILNRKNTILIVEVEVSLAKSGNTACCKIDDRFDRMMVVLNYVCSIRIGVD